MGFMKIWLENDTTVICAQGENRREMPRFIPISNPEGKLFSCENKAAGWHHKTKEREFLRILYGDYKASKSRPLRAKSAKSMI